MTPLHVAEKLQGWIVLERGIVKFTASTKQLWTTRLGTAHNTIQSSLSLTLSLSLLPSYPFSSSPSCSPLVSPPLIYLYLGSLDLQECSGSWCYNKHHLLQIVLSCNLWHSRLNPNLWTGSWSVSRDACSCICHILWCLRNVLFEYLKG